MDTKEPPKKVLAIIPSAGVGKRMGLKEKKNYLPLLGKPVLARTIEVFEECRLIDGIILVVPPSDEEYCSGNIVEKYGFKKISEIVPGGLERQDSVGNALKAAGDGWDIILVHDGARPLVTVKIIEDAVKAAGLLGAAICAVKLKDTVKEVSGGAVKKTVPRDGLVAVQTPQAFRSGILNRAFDKAQKEGYKGTDESSLVELAGGQVFVIDGSYDNIKITTKEDLALAEFILTKRKDMGK